MPAIRILIKSGIAAALLFVVSSLGAVGCGSEHESQASERTPGESAIESRVRKPVSVASTTKSARLKKRAAKTASLKKRKTAEAAKEDYLKEPKQAEQAVPTKTAKRAKTTAKKTTGPKELSGREIAQGAEDRPGYKHSEATALQMILTNSRGKSRKREFLRYQIKVNGGKKTLMKFLLPRDIKSTGTLNQEVIGRDDIQHLYLPAAKKLRRISSSNKSQSWVGSDYSFEDLQELELDDYTFEALGFEEIDSHTCYKYSMLPKISSASMYSKQIRWVRKDGFLPVRVDYYDKKGKLLKIWTASDFQTTNGIRYAWKLVMKNVQEKHTTDITRRWLKLDTGMDKGLLTTRHLQKSIEQYNHPKGLKELWKKTLPN